MGQQEDRNLNCNTPWVPGGRVGSAVMDADPLGAPRATGFLEENGLTEALVS